MSRHELIPWRVMALGLFAVLGFVGLLPAALAVDQSPVGARVFSAGHSFHVFMPAILREMAAAGGIVDHQQLGVQSIGGSRVIQHWNLEAPKNTVRPALEKGDVDVLTLSPIYLPDEGIEKLVTLGVEHNANLRVCLQEFWLPYDVYALNYQQKRPELVDRNARTGEQLRTEHAAYFKSLDEHAIELNRKLGRTTVFITPVGQAAILLREKIIAGEAPGLKQQNDLFTDAIGHATPPLQALCAYCHYAVIYRKSPVGLPMPDVLTRAKNEAWNEELNRLLQELAWKAATEHPLSGVKAERR